MPFYSFILMLDIDCTVTVFMNTCGSLEDMASGVKKNISSDTGALSTGPKLVGFWSYGHLIQSGLKGTDSPAVVQELEEEVSRRGIRYP